MPPASDRADDSPEQDAIRCRLLQTEIAENQVENKQIVRAQGELDQIAGRKLERGGAALPRVEENRKRGREQNPEALATRDSSSEGRRILRSRKPRSSASKAAIKTLKTIQMRIPFNLLARLPRIRNLNSGKRKAAVDDRKELRSGFHVTIAGGCVLQVLGQNGKRLLLGSGCPSLDAEFSVDRAGERFQASPFPRS
jgi:hypothetical protein